MLQKQSRLQASAGKFKNACRAKANNFIKSILIANYTTMKLHLPTSLRVVLLSAVAFLSTVPSASASQWTYTSSCEYYYTFPNCQIDSTSPKKVSALLANNKTINLIDTGTNSTVELNDIIAFNYAFSVQYITTHTHTPSPTNENSYTHDTKVVDVLNINQNGGGEDITWNCSSDNNPGVWILATTDCDPTVAKFTNYGDMVVNNSRQ